MPALGVAAGDGPGHRRAERRVVDRLVAVGAEVDHRVVEAREDGRPGGPSGRSRRGRRRSRSAWMPPEVAGADQAVARCGVSARPARTRSGQLGVDRRRRRRGRTAAEPPMGSAISVERVAVDVVGGRPAAGRCRAAQSATRSARLAGADDLGRGCDELGQGERAARTASGSSAATSRTCARSMPKMSEVAARAASAVMRLGPVARRGRGRAWPCASTAFGSAGRPSNSSPAEPTTSSGADRRQPGAQQRLGHRGTADVPGADEDDVDGADRSWPPRRRLILTGRSTAPLTGRLAHARGAPDGRQPSPRSIPAPPCSSPSARSTSAPSDLAAALEPTALLAEAARRRARPTAAATACSPRSTPSP